LAGGGGLGGPEGFKLIKELADLLKGSVGATRVPVDEDWVPLSMEIGQTGKIVGPDLYIAVGISGAAQHVTGCINSKTIISINKDSDANIFKISDFGLVADYKVALPVLIEKLKAGGHVVARLKRPEQYWEISEEVYFHTLEGRNRR